MPLDSLYTRFDYSSDSFQKELNLIQGRCVLAKIYSEDLYKSITLNFEMLEDKMADFCHSQSDLKSKSTESQIINIPRHISTDFMFEYLKNFIELIKKQHSEHSF